MLSYLAHLILEHYTKYKNEFMESCKQAKQRFENRNWDNDPATTAYRLKLYENCIAELHDAIAIQRPQMTIQVWLEIKQEYEKLVNQFPFPEHARTFFNSLARFYFQNEFFERKIYFELEEDTTRFIGTQKAIINNSVKQSSNLFLQINWHIKHQNIIEDTLYLQQVLLGINAEEITVEFYPELFYRNAKAYLLGRTISTANKKGQAFSLKFAHEEDGVVLEELLLGEDKVKQAFEFTRSYFWVSTPDSIALVNYLLKLMPTKPREQMFINIGYIRHGKSVMYDSLMKKLAEPDAKIVITPGVKGLVMQVFTIENYHLVFKIIKNRSSPPKNVTKMHVKNRYLFVAHHDRVGRIADTQEFNNLILKKHLFEPTILADLLLHSQEEVWLSGDNVVIRNVYLERKMVPLDIYIKDKEDRRSVSAIKDYGNAIKELAEANIFPGDLLIKNFGVTQEGRVIFYDYDEIVKVTDCNFRTFPEYDEDDDMDYYSAEPVYHVAPEDVFPQEFEKFLIPNGILKDVFIKHHGELFTAKYWQDLKEKILAKDEK